MSEVMAELKRIYGRDEGHGDLSWAEDFSPGEQAVWERTPDDLKEVAMFVGYDAMLPHEKVSEIFGAYTLVEYNSEDGTFGQLRDVVEDYAYADVLIIGVDTYMDVAGQIGEPGAVYNAIGYDFEFAELIAPSLLELLKACEAIQR